MKEYKEQKGMQILKELVWKRFSTGGHISSSITEVHQIIQTRGTTSWLWTQAVATPAPTKDNGEKIHDTGGNRTRDPCVTWT